MHKVFGIQENVNYIDRVGAYLIPVNEGKIGVVRTTKGYFLLGGGIDSGESHEECITRECLEEAGYKVSVGHKVCSAEMYCKHPTIDYNELKGNMYLEMQSWAIEQCMEEIF